MPSPVCSVRLHLPRPLFRKLMARAILERADLSAVVVRAVHSGLACDERLLRVRVRRLEKELGRAAGSGRLAAAAGRDRGRRG